VGRFQRKSPTYLWSGNASHCSGAPMTVDEPGLGPRQACGSKLRTPSAPKHEGRSASAEGNRSSSPLVERSGNRQSLVRHDGQCDGIFESVGSDLVHMDEGTFMWVSVKDFRFAAPLALARPQADATG
jgi:hypothetical protein